MDSLPPSSHREQPSLSSTGNDRRDGCLGSNQPQKCATMGCGFGPDGEATSAVLSTQSLSPPFKLVWPQQAPITLGSALKEQVCRGDAALLLCSPCPARHLHKPKSKGDASGEIHRKPVKPFCKCVQHIHERCFPFP